MNVNCWSKTNGEIRSKIVQYNKPDIICVMETHLQYEDVIDLPGYVFYGANRHNMLVKSNRGSGGIGILIKAELLNSLTAKVCFQLDDNVLGIKLSNLISKEEIVVFCVYLPPDNSRYGQLNETILNKLTIEMFNQCEASQVFICGDFNARIGKNNDCILNDNVPSRRVIDETSNNQGNRLLSFVSDINRAIVNGRITPECDDFTSMTSYKGKSVVDYHITRLSDLDFIQKMEVKSCIELVAKMGCEQLLTDRCHVPDHNLLSMTVELSNLVVEQMLDQNLGSKVWNRKIIRNPGESYMKSKHCGAFVG